MNYPKELFFPIENTDHLIARITLNIDRGSYYAEVDLLLNESRKIFHHVGEFYGFSDEDECLKTALDKTSLYFK